MTETNRTQENAKKKNVIQRNKGLFILAGLLVLLLAAYLGLRAWNKSEDAKKNRLTRRRKSA